MKHRRMVKRLTSFVLSAALLCGALCSMAVPMVSALSLGDLDGNGEVNMRDVLSLYRVVNGKKTLTDEQSAVADINQSGDINLRDVMKLYRVAVGKDTLSPIETETLTPISLEEYYGRQLLVDAGETALVTAYDRIGEYAAALETEIPLADLYLTFDEMERVVQYYADDHPEVFWFNTAYQFYYFEHEGVQYAYNLLQEYAYTADEIAALQEQLAARTAQLLEGLTDKTPELEREKTVHDRLLREADYDQSLSADHTHDLIGVMLNGTGVCESYARALQYLLHQCGIPAAVVFGKVNASEYHLWNVVKIDGAWYHVDPTWNDPILPSPLPAYMEHEYFNVTTARMISERTILDRTSSFVAGAVISYPIPVCTATDAYWMLSAAVEVSAFDAAVMGEALAAAIAAENYVYFRAVDTYTLAQLQADLQDAANFWAMIDEANARLDAAQQLSAPRYYAATDTIYEIYGLYLFE